MTRLSRLLQQALELFLQSMIAQALGSTTRYAVAAPVRWVCALRATFLLVEVMEIAAIVGVRSLCAPDERLHADLEASVR